MINKKIISLVLLMAMVPFIMGPMCLTGGLDSYWQKAVFQDAMLGLTDFYEEQNENIQKQVGWVNANAAYQFQLLQVRQLWGEDIVP
ncbi:hypothetical protein ACFLVM_00520 [Chloroflexota bacterium]